MACEDAIAERQLVVNADDFGLSAGVNRGIIEAHEAGSVTSISLLANAPGFADAVSRLSAAPRLGVGLHLNFTAGSPVAPRNEITSLWNRATGKFYPLASLVRRAIAGRIVPAHVAIECAAQIECLHAVGIRVTHIDGHHHVHVLPGVWEPVLACARRAGVPAVRVPIERLDGGPVRAGVMIKQVCVRAAWQWAARGDRGNDLRQAEHFFGMALQGSPRFQDGLVALLDRLAPGTTELMVHPGYVDEDLTLWDGYTAQRERELAALRSAELRTRLTRGDIVLRGFGKG